MLKLFKYIEDKDVKIIEDNIPIKNLKGLYCDGEIILEKRLNTVSKRCVLAEEIGHHETNYGNILEQEEVDNRKQEKHARNWAFEKLIPIHKFLDAFNYGCKNKFEIAEYLEVTEEFLLETIQHYKEKYGLCYTSDKCIIRFEPLQILKIFEIEER